MSGSGGGPYVSESARAETHVLLYFVLLLGFSVAHDSEYFQGYNDITVDVHVQCVPVKNREFNITMVRQAFCPFFN